MSVALYLDVHVPAPIMRALLARGVDVLTAQADGTTRLNDSDLLDRARELGRVLFSRDEDFLAEATKRQRSGGNFTGLITRINSASPLAAAFKTSNSSRNRPIDMTPPSTTKCGFHPLPTQSVGSRAGQVESCQYPYFPMTNGRLAAGRAARPRRFPATTVIHASVAAATPYQRTDCF